MIKKCRELNGEIVNNGKSIIFCPHQILTIAAKVQTALKLSQDDRNTITSLRAEVQKAWKMVDSSHEKELRAKETIQQLKVEISNLSRLVEQGAGLSVGQENTVKELMKAKEDLEKKNAELKATGDGLSSKLQEMHGKMEKKEKAREDLQTKVDELQDIITTKKAKEERELRHKERMDKELKDIKTQLEATLKVQDNLTLSLDQRDEKINKLEAQLKQARNAMEKYLRDYDALFQRTQVLTSDCDEQIHKREILANEVTQLQNDIVEKDDEIRRRKEEIASLTRVVERGKKKEKELEHRIADEVTVQEVLKAEKNSLEKELDMLIRKEQDLGKKIQEKERESKIFQGAVQRGDAKNKTAEEKLSMSEATVKQLENEITIYKKEAVTQRSLIIQLEKDRER